MAEVQKEIELEIAHVLFIDVVGYSKLVVEKQRRLLELLNELVRATQQVRKAEANNRLITIPTGDGMALVFYNTPEAPVECALEVSRAAKQHPELKVRMGVHSGAVSGVIDVSGRANIAGAGINIAQRVMDCGDAGHILLSRHVAEDLEQLGHWKRCLHDLGEIEVKHGMRVSAANLYTDELGNPALPQKFLHARHKAATAPLVREKKNRVWMIPILLALTAALVVGAGLLFRRVASPTPAAPEKSIAVLPFANLSGDPDNAYFADGIQEEILTRLAKIADLKVISRTSTLRYKSAPENLPEIAKQLGVANILEGSVQKSADAVRVNVQLIKAANDSHLWADTFDRKLIDTFAIESEIAKAIADKLQAKINGREQNAIAARPTENSEAHQLYLKGRYFWNKRTASGLKTSIDYFNEAIERDPGYGPAYTGLADAYAVLPNYSQTPGKEAYPKAEAAAIKALQIDDNLAEAHVSLANIRLWHKWARGADAEFRKGLELNPNYSTGHQWYSIYLSVVGRRGEAIAEMEKARELDPFSIIINTELGCPYLYSQQPDRAIAYFRKAVEMDPDFAFAHFALAEGYDRIGHFQEAMAEHEKAITLARRGQAIDLAGGDAPRAWYSLTGRLQNSRNALAGSNYWHEQLATMINLNEQGTAPASAVAEIYAILGDKEQALQWLEKAYQQSDDFLVFLNILPGFDRLRSEPRFQALVRKIFDTEASVLDS